MKLMWYCCSWIARSDMENSLVILQVIWTAPCVVLFTFILRVITLLIILKVSIIWPPSWSTVYILYLKLNQLWVDRTVRLSSWKDPCLRTHMVQPFVFENPSVVVLICSCGPGTNGASDTLTIFSYCSKWCCFLLLKLLSFTQSYVRTHTHTLTHAHTHSRTF